MLGALPSPVGFGSLQGPQNKFLGGRLLGPAGPQKDGFGEGVWGQGEVLGGRRRVFGVGENVSGDADDFGASWGLAGPRRELCLFWGPAVTPAGPQAKGLGMV